eukprot:5178367-Amphidinium_carterae.1
MGLEQRHVSLNMLPSLRNSECFVIASWLDSRSWLKLGSVLPTWFCEIVRRKVTAYVRRRHELLRAMVSACWGVIASRQCRSGFPASGGAFPSMGHAQWRWREGHLSSFNADLTTILFKKSQTRPRKTWLLLSVAAVVVPVVVGVLFVVFVFVDANVVGQP